MQCVNMKYMDMNNKHVPALYKKGTLEKHKVCYN